MTVAKDRLSTKPMSLQAYLDYDDGTDYRRYELWDGILVDMGAESELNILIESFLRFVLSQLISYKHVRKGTEIAIKGKLANTRFPDLLVLTDEGLAALVDKKRSLITFEMPAPLIAVEIVSSSSTDKQSKDRDYIEKRNEFAKRGILEYWIVDPIASVVLVLTLDGESYQEQIFTKDSKIISPVLPELDLRASQLLNAEM